MSSVYLQSANFSSATDTRIAGSMTNVERVEKLTLTATHTSLSPEQQSIAEDVSIKAFFDDLKDNCHQTLIVIMLDAYEKCPDQLQEWLRDCFLQRHFFDHESRPEKLILIIAGRKVPPFEQYWSSQDVQATVQSVMQLRTWKKAHIEECLRVYGFEHLLPEIDFFYRMIELGVSPSLVVTTMQSVAEGRRHERGVER